jgi:hypothetical protein
MTPRLRPIFAAAFFALILIGTMSRTAYAYLDPGTGSMILQILLGGLAGAAVVLKLYWHKFKALFGSRRSKEAASENDDTP